jgi:NAD(P)-dependent dehydrogenase (short-subunit alcohol dehydrogenase family)
MKVAIITGAASGIGLALSSVCLQKGFNVVMVDKDSSKLKQEALQLAGRFPQQVLDFTCDVTQSLDVDALAKAIMTQLGRIDWIFNNAGIMGTLAPVWELSAEQLHNVFNVNVYGMMNIIHTFTPYLFKQNVHSHIINMASMYALCSGSQMAAYSMSKHAVLALSESLYFDLKRMEKPVDVSVVFPSFTDTALLAHNNSDSTFHSSLESLLAHSRPALEVALHIVQEVEKKCFYILPDKEVKGYCEERTNSIIRQENPHVNNIEKLMISLLRRKDRR